MNLRSLRERIDALDSTILAALGDRFQVCREVADVKRRSGIDVMQANRVEEVKSRCAKMGEDRGLRPEFVERLYALIIDEVCTMEQRVIDEADRSSNA